MKLLVDGITVQMEYLYLEVGHILQILISSNANDRPCWYDDLMQILDTGKGGIMNQPTAEEGFSEIRILGGTMLEAIDMMRRAGFGVREMI